MDIPSLSCQSVRMVDQSAMHDFAVPGVILMENAGRNAAEILMKRNMNGPVLIACGKGNNGGDGFVIARHLDNRKIPVQVFLTCSPDELKGDALINFEIIRKSSLPIQLLENEEDMNQFRSSLEKSEWIVDALLGTGVSGEIRGIYRKLIELINQGGLHVMAVDIPSGLDGDTGEILGVAVKAEFTVTFVARKTGFDNPASKEITGDVHVADIGVPRIVLENILSNQSGENS